MDRGITCVEPFDFDVVDKIYRPCDNLALRVILRGDGTRDCRVLGAMTEAVKARASEAEQWERVQALLRRRTRQPILSCGLSPASRNTESRLKDALVRPALA